MYKTKFTIVLLVYCFCLTTAQTNNLSSDKKFNKYFDSLKFSISRRFFNDPNGTKKDALHLVKIAKSRQQRVESLHLLGYVYDLTGKVDSAKYCLENRLELTSKYFLNTPEHYQAVIDYTNWGMEYIDSAVLVELLTKTMSTLDDKKNKKELRLMSMLLGDVFLRDKNFEKANFYYEKSFKKIDSKLAAVDYYERKGNLNIAKNNFKEAKNNFEKAITVLDNKTVFVYAGYLKSLGYINYRLKNFEEARKKLNESLLLQRKFNYSNLNSETFLCLSYLEKEAKNYSTEKKYLDSAMVHNDGDLLLLKDINLAYSDYYSRKNDFDSEKHFFSLYTKNLDSINNTEKNKAKLKMESLYQLKESKKALALKGEILEKESLLKKVYLISSFALFILTIVIFWIFYKKFKTQKKLNKNQYSLHEQTLKLMQENQRTEIIKEKIKAKLEERGKLSLELHDGIANEIGALKLSISDERVLTKKEIDSIVIKIDKLYHEVRNLSHDLDPDNIADVEFSQLVNNLCLIIEKSGIKTIKNIYISKNVDDLDERILLNIYRILQEAINNTLKHASATEIQVDVMDSEEELFMRVKDNGVGFTNAITKPGIGLRNIEKRVNLLNGKYEIFNSSKGTTIDIRIPKNIDYKKDILMDYEVFS